MKFIWIVALLLQNSLFGAEKMEIESPDCHILCKNLRICADKKLIILKSENPLEARDYISISDFIVALEEQIHDIFSQNRTVKSISFEACYLNYGSLKQITQRIFEKYKKLRDNLEMLSFYDNPNLNKKSQGLILSLTKYPRLSFLSLNLTTLSHYILDQKIHFPENIIPENIILGTTGFLRACQSRSSLITDAYIEHSESFYRYKEDIVFTPLMIRKSVKVDFTPNIETILSDDYATLDIRYKMGIAGSLEDLTDFECDTIRANFWINFLKEEEITQEQKVEAIYQLIRLATKETYQEDTNIWIDIMNQKKGYMDFSKVKMEEILESFQRNLLTGSGSKDIILMKKLASMSIYITKRFDSSYKTLAQSILNSIHDSPFSTEHDQKEVNASSGLLPN